MRRRLCLSRKVWVKELREAPKAWDWKGAEHNLSLICLRAVLDRLKSLAEQSWAGGTAEVPGTVESGRGKLQHGQLLNLQTQMSRAETRGTFTTASPPTSLEQHVPFKKKKKKAQIKITPIYCCVFSIVVKERALSSPELDLWFFWMTCIIIKLWRCTVNPFKGVKKSI